MPRPTNAQALAALNAAFEPVDIDHADGYARDTAQRWVMPDGILPRMRLVACGWKNPGDRFRAAEDAAWWARPYELPMWVPLLTYAQTSEKAGQVGWLWDDAMARGDSTALSHGIISAQSELDKIVAARSDKCLPYFVPKRAGVQPLPNKPCLVALAAARKGLPEKIPGLKPPNPFHVPDWMYWAVIAYVITKIAK